MARKSASGGGTIRQRPDGRWEARFCIGTDDATGKLIRKSVYADTQKAVRKKMVAALRAVDTHTYAESERIKLADWLEKWLASYVENVLKGYTYVAYEVEIRRHIVPIIGAVRLSDLTTAHVQKMIQTLIKQGYSPKTVKNVHGCLSAALAQAVTDGKIATNPCAGAKLPKMVQPEIKPLTIAQMTALLDAAVGDEYEDVILVCLFCGLRKGECLGLSWRQVDFEKSRLTIDQQLYRQTLKRGGYTISTTKSGNRRYIDVPPICT